MAQPLWKFRRASADVLTSLAGSMRRRGMSAEAIAAALMAQNAQHCHPPLPEREVRAIAESVSRYAPTGEPIIPKEVPLGGIGRPDMPDAVLDGRLGEIYQRRLSNFPLAYGWGSFLTAVGVLVNRQAAKVRTNLFWCPVGPKGTSKSTAMEYSFKVAGVEAPVLMQGMFGSAEGLVDALTDGRSDHCLLAVDELSPLLAKAAIDRSSFPTVFQPRTGAAAGSLQSGEEKRTGCGMFPTSPCCRRATCGKAFCVMKITGSSLTERPKLGCGSARCWLSITISDGASRRPPSI
jgi:hypothetical protein